MKMKHLLTAQLQVFTSLSPVEAVEALTAHEHFAILEAVIKQYLGSSQHAELQTAACCAIYASGAAGASKAVAAGCVKAVAAAMAAHPQNAELQTAACSAIAGCASNDVAGASKAVAAGGVETVAAAMAAHPRNAELQKNALTSLLAILGHSSDAGNYDLHICKLAGHSDQEQQYHDVVKQLRTAPVGAAKLAFPEPHAVGVLATRLLSLEVLSGMVYPAVPVFWVKIWT